ncbi:hypothetical protein [Streptomyces tritici]
MSEPTRRTLLTTGAASALTLGTVSFAQAGTPDGDRTWRTT